MQSIVPINNKPTVPVLIVLVLIVGISAYAGRVIDFNYALWAVDYSHGFVRRGLGGEILGWFLSPPYPLAILDLLAAAAFVILALLIGWFFLSRRSFSVEAATVILGSGFFLQQLGYDQGKFDVWLLFLLVVALALIQIRRPLVTLLLLGAVTTIALLMHEGAALIVVPSIVAALWIQPLSVKARLQLTGSYFALALAIFSAVYIFGSSDMPAEQRYLEAVSLMPFLTPDNDVFNIAVRTLSGNVDWALERLEGENTPSRMMLNLAASLPFLLLLGISLLQLWPVSRASVAGAGLVMISMLPLYVLGIDFYRWNALILTLVFVYLAYAGHLLGVRFRIPPSILIGCCLFSLWSGPFGVTLALPERGFLVTWMVDQSLVE